MNQRTDRNRDRKPFCKKLAEFSVSVAAALPLTTGFGLRDAIASSKAPKESPSVERRLELVLDISGAGSSTVNYDSSGSPHIRAESEAGAYAGLCWAVARDRLFQLDLFRRSAKGRLSEVFGAGPDDAVLAQDKLFRVLGLDAIAAGLFSRASEHSQRVVTACAAGIETHRASVAANPERLPREFGDLGYVPEPWTAQDSMLMAVNFSASLDMGAWMTKLANAALAANLPPEVRAAIAPGAPQTPSLFDATGAFNSPNTAATRNPSTTASIAPATLSPMPAASTKHALQFPRLPLAAATKGWRASNNFVVSGMLSSTGKPILANDPHLQLAMPSLFYQAQLTVTGGIRVAGYLTPGFPAFLLGHNANIGWAITYAMLDTADLFLETIDGLGAANRKAPWSQRTETFKIAGGEPVSLQVLTTSHGPVLNGALPELNAFGPISLKNTLSQIEYHLDGLIDLAAADDWNEFRCAVRELGLGLNYLYADNLGASGNIGYQMSGLAPQRSAANATGPVPGDDGGFEWTGYAQFTALPNVFNPPQGFISTSNNRIVPDHYAPDGVPIYLSSQWDEPFRVQRSNYLLANARRPITPDYVARMQSDTTSVAGPPLARSLAGAVRRSGLHSDDAAAEGALRLLERWNGNVAAYSRGAAVYEAVVALLIQNLVRDAIGPDLYRVYANSVFQTTQLHALSDLVANPRPPFFGATSLDDAPGARDRAVRKAVAEAAALLAHALGGNRAGWTWGALHTLTYNHPLAPLDPAFALPSRASSGDPSTLNTGGWFGGQSLLALPPERLDAAGGAVAAFAQDAIATSRMVLNLDNFGTSRWISSTGQSGDPASPHWADQAALWRNGRYLTTPFP